MGALSCQSNLLDHPTNLFTHRDSEGDKVKTTEIIISTTARLGEETRDSGGDKARATEVILSASDQLGEEENRLGLLLQQEPFPSTTTVTKHTKTIDNKGGLNELGHKSPHEHISHLKREMEPRGLAQQDNLSTTACTTMPEKVGTLELLQDLSSTMIRLLSFGTFQPLLVNVANQVAGSFPDIESSGQARPLTLTPVEAAVFPTSLPNMIQCEVCSETCVPSKDLQKHRLEHELVQNTKCKTELIDSFPSGLYQARLTPPLPALCPAPAAPLSEDYACEAGDDTAPNKDDFKKHMVAHKRLRPVHTHKVSASPTFLNLAQAICEICKETFHHEFELLQVLLFKFL
mgnify:CR=1 FL=1